MSGQWEQYVEPAAEPLDSAAFDQSDPQHDHWAMDLRRGIARDRARKALAVVGPLIAEDTRVRMVEAAGRAVERDRTACADRAKVAEEIAVAFEEARSIPGWGVFSRQGDRMTAARMVRLYARQLDAKDAS